MRMYKILQTCEVTLVQGVENAVNYIMKEVKAGRLKVSRNGIEKVGE